MEIKSQFEYLGKIAKAHWVEDNPLKDFPADEKLDGVHSFCFCGDKMVVVLNKKGMWTPPGGYIEPGETYEDASIREIKEESNMKVLYQKCLGYQDVTDEYGKNRSRQVRMFCIVEPYGDFELGIEIWRIQVISKQGLCFSAFKRFVTPETFRTP